MIYPEFIKKGDWFGVTAPSDGNGKEVDQIRLNNAMETLMSMGYPVVETPDVRVSVDGRSGSAKQRADEFMSLIHHPKVKTIVSAKGGDFLCEMLSLLDFEEIKKNPKWIQGYSDNTGILFTLTTMCDIATIYGNNFNDFGMENWHKAVSNNFELLTGKLIEQESFDYFENDFHDRITGLESYEKDEKVEWKFTKSNENMTELMIKGRLIGGCLDVLLNLVGTRFDHVKEFTEKYAEDGILWYLESFETNHENLVRSLWQLREAGWFKNSRGFVFGRPCMYSSYSGKTYQETVEYCLGDLGLPMIFDADIGHRGPQFSIVNGAKACIYSGYGTGKLKMFFE